MNSLLQGNALLALAAALMWGGGDFSGGMGVKTVGGTVGGSIRIVMLSHFTSIVALLTITQILGLSFPHGATLAWGLAAGVLCGLSLVAFYIALARGAMGASAAISGLLAAAIPAIVSIATNGSPGLLHLVGFLVAGGAIWLIAAEPSSMKSSVNSTMALAVAAGFGFGCYFVALKMASPAGPVWAMATARIGSLAICSMLMAGLSLAGRGEHGIRLTSTAIKWVLLTALMDTSGNMLFVAATRAGRLDIAAVLASLYPATTILLAAWYLKERPTRRQGIGMLVAAAAVVMIAL